MHIHDPCQNDGQGEDIGSQYVSAIFCQNEKQK
jgi:peptide methionine sulfoxide reductase MsrA